MTSGSTTNAPWARDLTDIWARMMTTGKACLAANHASCGCSGTCGGCDEARNSNEHHRLAWARLVAESSGPSLFWATMAGAEAYFAAGPCAPSSTSRISDSVDFTREIMVRFAPYLPAFISPFDYMGLGAFAQEPRVLSGSVATGTGVRPGENEERVPRPAVVTLGDEFEKPRVYAFQSPTYAQMVPVAADGDSTGDSSVPCCCIAAGIEVDVREEDARNDMLGMKQSYIAIEFFLDQGDQNSNPCTVEWAEFTTVSYTPFVGPTVPAWKWAVLTNHPAFKSMARDALKFLEDPCPEGDVPKIVDRPAGGPFRVLVIRVTLKSGCDGSSITRYIIQIISPEGVTVTVKDMDALFDLLWRKGEKVVVK